MIAATGTIQGVEVLWTAIGIAGLVLSFINLRESIDDRNVLVWAGRNGPAIVYAKGQIVLEAIRLAMQVAIVGIGVAAMLVAPTPRRPEANVIVASIIFFGLFFMSGALAFKSWYARRIRRRVGDKVEGR